MRVLRLDFDEKDRNFMIVQFEDKDDKNRIVKWRAEVTL
jgi:hypothetical protein